MYGVTASGSAGDVRPRLVELVAALSLAADLGLGQPMEHGMRACVIATRLARRLGYDERTCDDVYWVSLLGMVGCTADSYELHQIWGDDLALRAGMFTAGPAAFSMAGYFLSRAGSNGGPAHRVRQATRLLASGMQAVAESMTAHCQVTERLAEQLQLGPGRSRPAPAHVRALGRQGGATRAVRRGDRPPCAPVRCRRLHRGRASAARGRLSDRVLPQIRRDRDGPGGGRGPRRGRGGDPRRPRRTQLGSRDRR